MVESGLQLYSLITSKGELRIGLEEQSVPAPEADEIVVKMEAVPLNPSDLALLSYPADLSTGRTTGEGVDTVYSAEVPEHLMELVKARVGAPVPIGNEGSGTVIHAGSSAEAQALLGRTVAVIGGAMLTQYRVVKAGAALPMPEDVAARQAASSFVNPMTAQAMVECMRLEGYEAIVHTAAASNLGQMLNRLCQKDGVNLINIVRNEEQEKILRDSGARYVFNSTSENFSDELTAAIAKTKAYLCFDAVGGGEIVENILVAMENAATKGAGSIGPYGSDTFKQIYIYGGLDRERTTLGRSYGFHWGVSGWLTSPFLARLDGAKLKSMRRRVADEITTTFASTYDREVSLVEALQAENVLRYSRQSTGVKYLINPSFS